MTTNPWHLGEQQRWLETSEYKAGGGIMNMVMVNLLARAYCRNEKASKYQIVSIFFFFLKNG